MSIITSTGYLIKDIKEELKTKLNRNINFYQFTFVFITITIFLVYSLYTIAIIRINISIVTVIMTSSLFFYTMYKIYFSMRAMRLCDNILKKDKEMLLGVRKMLNGIKKNQDDLFNIRRRLNKRLQKKKHRS